MLLALRKKEYGAAQGLKYLPYPQPDIPYIMSLFVVTSANKT